jgi:hypothetical protein
LFVLLSSRIYMVVEHVRMYIAVVGFVMYDDVRQKILLRQSPVNKRLHGSMLSGSEQSRPKRGRRLLY